MSNPLSAVRDPDILSSFKALRRAARRARELAFRTGTPLYVMQNGRIVNLNPAARRTRRKAHGIKAVEPNGGKKVCVSEI